MQNNYPPGAAADPNAPYNQAADHADAPHVTQYLDECKVDLLKIRAFHRVAFAHCADLTELADACHSGDVQAIADAALDVVNAFADECFTSTHLNIGTDVMENAARQVRHYRQRQVDDEAAAARDALDLAYASVEARVAA